MGEAKRRILHLPETAPSEQAEGQQAEPLEEAETAMHTVAELRERLNDALQEINELKKRAAGVRRMAVLNRADFISQLGSRLSGSSPQNGCIVRVSVTNIAKTRRELGDEAAEELCVGVGRWLSGHVRNTDIVGRAGTATFTVFFAFAEVKNVAEKMDRLTARIERTPMMWNVHTLFPEVSVEIQPVGEAD